VQHIGAATSLTSVLITTRVLYSDAQICRHLTGLQQLRELELGYEAGRGYPRDTLHLTALTGELTYHMSVAEHRLRCHSLWLLFALRRALAVNVLYVPCFYVVKCGSSGCSQTATVWHGMHVCGLH
jgi:hypothetical protein